MAYENWEAGLEDLIPAMVSPMHLGFNCAYLGTWKDYKVPDAAGIQ